MRQREQTRLSLGPVPLPSGVSPCGTKDHLTEPPHPALSLTFDTPDVISLCLECVDGMLHSACTSQTAREGVRVVYYWERIASVGRRVPLYRYMPRTSSKSAGIAREHDRTGARGRVRADVVCCLRSTGYAATSLLRHPPLVAVENGRVQDARLWSNQANRADCRTEGSCLAPRSSGRSLHPEVHVPSGSILGSGT